MDRDFFCFLLFLVFLVFDFTLYFLSVMITDRQLQHVVTRLAAHGLCVVAASQFSVVDLGSCAGTLYALVVCVLVDLMMNKRIGKPRQTRLAAGLLEPGRRWCVYCKCSFEIKYQHLHEDTPRHRNAMYKFGGMKRLATSLWERHRGAPADEDIGEEREREILRHVPRASGAKTMRSWIKPR